MRVTEAEMDCWKEQGYFVRANQFSATELEPLRKSAEHAGQLALKQTRQNAARTYHLDDNRFVDVGDMTVQFEHRSGSDTVRVIEPVHTLVPAFAELIEDARLCEPMRDLVGAERLALWTDKLNLKRPQEGSGFGWHQDSPYWVHDCEHVDQLPNVYLAFDDANRSNGCLRVVSGSHTQGCLPGRADGTQLGGFYTDAACIDGEDIVYLEVSAGSLVFFSAHSIHGSQPNESLKHRRAIIVTYQPADHPMLKTGRVKNVGDS